MRILFVAPYVPSPIRVRPYQWIRTLSKLGHQIRLVVLQPPEDSWLSEIPVRECCESVEVFPLTRLRTLVNATGALPWSLPLQAAYSRHPAAERFVADQARDCDVVHVEHLRGALLARRVSGVPTVIDAVDSISALFEQAGADAPSWQHRLMARADLSRTRKFEASLPLRFDRTVVSSRHDAAAFRRLAGSASSDRVVAVPNGVDLEYFRPDARMPERATVLFTGKMSYHANEAAALRLVERIMPLVWQRRPDVKVTLAGKDPSPAVKHLARDPRVTVTGFVDDFRPLFWSTAVVAAPLVYGTGIQKEVLEAMACGAPVVASPNACEALNVLNGRELLVGEDDDQFARQMLLVMRDAGVRQQIAREGRRYVVTHHDWCEMGRRLIAVYEDVRTAHRRCA